MSGNIMQVLGSIGNIRECIHKHFSMVRISLGDNFILNICDKEELYH